MQSKAPSLSLPAVTCFAVLFCAATVITSPAQNVFFTTMVNFDDNNGRYGGALIQTRDGTFFGTTTGGGAYGSWGTVFTMTPAGMLTTLYSFCASGYPCSDGDLPTGLMRATDGNFYGTTYQGGPSGFGTIFKITPTGTLTTLHIFDGSRGTYPSGPLVQGSDGDLYGDTEETIFKITTGGILTTLYDNFPDDRPNAPLVQAADGNFYGTTRAGGDHDAGTVFKITPSGALTRLYSFCASGYNCLDGASPSVGLVQARDGSFYGTTAGGGANGYGTVFKFTPTGTLTTLHSFDWIDGAYPGFQPGALIQASDGNFYGISLGGLSLCNYGCGTVFKISPSGTLTTLHFFSGPDGLYPTGAVVQARDGSFYGTTFGGGAYGYGTVFRIGVVRTCATCRP